jgi:hypothetical protein
LDWDEDQCQDEPGKEKEGGPGGCDKQRRPGSLPARFASPASTRFDPYHAKEADHAGPRRHRETQERQVVAVRKCGRQSIELRDRAPKIVRDIGNEICHDGKRQGEEEPSHSGCRSLFRDVFGAHLGM